MKPNLRLAALMAGLLLTTQVFSQTAPKIDEKSRPAVEQLRAIVKEIKKCPEVMFYESKDKKGPFAGMRLYVGPTLNVEWEVEESKSIRSPYRGYVEVRLAKKGWIPADVFDKYSAKMGPHYAKMFIDPPPEVNKYEFDLGPNGLELYRSFYRSSDETEWKDLKLTGGFCWDEAVRKGVSGTGEKQQ